MVGVLTLALSSHSLPAQLGGIVLSLKTKGTELLYPVLNQLWAAWETAVLSPISELRCGAAAQLGPQASRRPQQAGRAAYRATTDLPQASTEALGRRTGISKKIRTQKQISVCEQSQTEPLPSRGLRKHKASTQARTQGCNPKPENIFHASLHRLGEVAAFPINFQEKLQRNREIHS